jgi:hypothetical protein
MQFIKDDRQGYGNPRRQAKDIDDAVQFVVTHLSDRHPKIIEEHTLRY